MRTPTSRCSEQDPLFLNLIIPCDRLCNPTSLHAYRVTVYLTILFNINTCRTMNCGRARPVFTTTHAEPHMESTVSQSVSCGSYGILHPSCFHQSDGLFFNPADLQSHQLCHGSRPTAAAIRYTPIRRSPTAAESGLASFPTAQPNCLPTCS